MFKHSLTHHYTVKFTIIMFKYGTYKNKGIAKHKRLNKYIIQLFQNLNFKPPFQGNINDNSKNLFIGRFYIRAL